MGSYYFVCRITLCLLLAFGSLHLCAQTISIPFKFDYAESFSDGVAQVRVGDQTYYIDKTGQIVVRPEKFDTYYKFSNGLARVLLKGKWGYIDKRGKVAIPLKFGNAKDFSQNRAIVSFDEPSISGIFAGANRYGVIDVAGRFVINPFLNIVFDYSDGVAVAHFGPAGESTVGAFDLNGARLFAPKFSSIYPFNDGIAAALSEGRGWGLIDKIGDWVLAPSFDALGDLKEGLILYGACQGKVHRPYDFRLEKSCRFGYIDRTGKVLIPAQFNYATNFNEGRAAVSFSVSTSPIPYTYDSAVRFGYIDTFGRLVVDPVYTEVRSFVGGVAAVKKPGRKSGEGKWGYIDRTGRPLTDFVYDAAYDVSDGLAAVLLSSGKWGYLSFRH